MNANDVLFIITAAVVSSAIVMLAGWRRQRTAEEHEWRTIPRFLLSLNLFVGVLTAFALIPVTWLYAAL